MSWSSLKFNEAGLVAVVAQDHRSGEVRMLAYANVEALQATVDTGYAHFFSRSRNQLWLKGETSGNRLQVIDLWVDCDRDAVIYRVLPEGPTCHTGAENCFLYRRDSAGEFQEGRCLPALHMLETVIEARKTSSAGKSYTRSLLDGGAPKIGAKMREEADEFACALADETDTRVVSEAADVMYHLMVGLVSRGVSLLDVQSELARRFGTSGHTEKASRTSES